MCDLTGKTVIITGATGNLGRATASVFAAHGARLALLARDPKTLEATCAALPAHAEAAVFPTDLLLPAQVCDTLDRIVARFGGVQALAHLAGGFSLGPPLHETSDAAWNAMLDLNLRTLFHCARAVIPRLLESGGGRIITVSARAARQGLAHMAPYSVSKSAVITLTESLSDELKHHGINVNCVLPGTLDTPQNRAAMPDADHSTWLSPRAVADVILFLASDASRGITGAAIPVYGRS